MYSVPKWAVQWVNRSASVSLSLFWEISSLLLLFCHLTGSGYFALLGQYYACEMQVAVDDMDFSSVNEDLRNCSISCLS